MSALDPAAAVGVLWTISVWFGGAVLVLLAANGFRRWYGKCSR